MEDKFILVLVNVLRIMSFSFVECLHAFLNYHTLYIGDVLKYDTPRYTARSISSSHSIAQGSTVSP